MVAADCRGVAVTVLHVTYTYPPAEGGGTEIYVAELCRHLRDLGVHSIVAAPRRDPGEAVIDGTPVYWFAADPATQTIETLYGAGDPAASAAFSALLHRIRPDVVHQHAVSPACSVDLARRATDTGVPVVCTVHTPAVFCQQGSLLRWGRVPCDVAWAPAVCTDCVLHTRGAPAPARALLRWLPARLTSTVTGTRQGGVWTAARMPTLMTTRLGEVDALFGLAARTVTLGPWTTALLRRNGVADERIVEVAHGTSTTPPIGKTRASRTGPRRLVGLGRLDRTKGFATAVAVVTARPDLAVTLDIFGLTTAVSADDERLAIERAAAADARIRLHAAIPHNRVRETLTDFDAVIVPSQAFETGPLVVLEAFAAGVPVIGSRLGGLAEKIRHDVDGLLVDRFADVDAWAATIARCVDEPDLLPRLAAAVRPPRAMTDVAREMHAIYAAVTRGAARKDRGA